MAVGYHTDDIGHDHEAHANDVAAEIAAAGGQAYAIGCDVRDPASIDAAVASVVERCGNVDVLVNNAGITRDRSLAKMSREEWDAVLETNLSSVFHLTARVLPHMVEARLRPHRQHQLRGRPARQLRPGQLRRGQGGDRRLHQDRGARARPQGRDGQRDRARLHRDRR